MILILTNSADFYNVDLFCAYLEERKVDFCRINTDKLNHSIRFELDSANFLLEIPGKASITGKDVRGVWHRKSWEISVPADLADEYQGIYKNEYASFRHILYRTLDHVPWINPLFPETKIIKNKLLQLKLAKMCGLLVPPTIFTNDPLAVQKFVQNNPSERYVAKFHNHGKQSMSGESLMGTVVLEKEDLSGMDGLEYAPMIIQPYINKMYEVRAAYINGKCFAGKINFRNASDWRTAPDLFWDHEELPIEIKLNLARLMQKMNLIQGAIDLIRDPDGHYYFLEINPQGEWGMLQKELGLPIAENIAQTLIDMTTI